MKKKMILIDASGLLFRAYYAILNNKLATKDGQPTGAVFGFLRMIFNLIKTHPCNAAAAAFDVPRSTLERTKQYSDYKATRKETPQELISQIPIAKECLNDAGIPALSIDGYEADDVLASIVEKYKDEYEILIFTGDKDLLQLVSDNVKVALPDKAAGVKILDRDGVKEHKGVYPDEICDYLAITGDTSDNVPGVKGIGDKGAIQLIEEFHSLENIYNNLPSIKPALAKKLEESRENAFLSLELVQLNRNLNVEVQGSDEVLTLSRFVTPEFLNKLQDLELFSLLKELSVYESPDNLFSAPKAEIRIQEFSLNTLDALGKQVYTALQFMDGALQFAGGEDVYRLDLDRAAEFSSMINMYFKAMDEEEKRLIVFDQKLLMHILKPYNITLPLCDDVKIIAYLLDPARSEYSVEYLSRAYLGKNEDTARVLYELRQNLGKQLVASGIGKVYYNIEMPLRSILFGMEDKGIAVDLDILKVLSKSMGEIMHTLESTIYHLAGKEFNILSPKQLGKILFEDLGLKPYKKTKSKSYSTDEETLEYLALSHPLPKEVLAYRSMSKFKNTYTDALAKSAVDGRIHTTLHQTVTATGRLSSADPNLQNIPIRTEWGREIRKAFIAGAGKKIISADYSQIELRLFASLSGDPTMIEYFKSGGDIHRHTAAAIFGIPESEVTDAQRRAAKTINFGISYGMSAFRLSNELNIDMSDARKFIDRYFDSYPGIRDFMHKTLETACKQGYVATLFGRVRPAKDLLGKTPDKITALSHTSRFAINAVVQGTAADIIKIAMIKVDELIKQKYKDSVSMLLQVHDELIFEAEESSAESFSADLKDIMMSAASLAVPLEVELGIGNSWFEAH